MIYLYCGSYLDSSWRSIVFMHVGHQSSLTLLDLFSSNRKSRMRSLSYVPMLLGVLWATIILSVVEVDAASSAQRPSKYYKRIHERRGTKVSYPKFYKKENDQPKRSLQVKETKSPKDTKTPKETKSVKSTKRSSQETVAPKAPTMAPTDTKSPKLSKSPKDTKSPEKTKAPKETKSVKSTKAPKSTEPTVKKTNVQLLSSTNGSSKHSLFTTSVVGVSAAALIMSI